MENEKLIPIKNLCKIYDVEVSFISSLNEFGLVEVITIEETQFIDKDFIGDLEKMMRFHYDLDINLAGIDAISHLLKRVSEMQDQLNVLKNKLGEG